MAELIDIICIYTTLIPTTDLIYKQIVKMLTELFAKLIKKHMSSQLQKEIKKNIKMLEDGK